MQNIENPYAAPTTKSIDARSDSPKRKRSLFSPTQGAVGAFLFGPLTGLYIIYANFSAMEDYPRRLNAIAYGSAIILAVTLLLPLLPEKVPGMVFSLLYMLPTRYVMDSYQLKKQQILDSEQYTFQSNWMVFGIGLLGAICFLLLVVVAFFVCAALGLVPPLW